MNYVQHMIAWSSLDTKQMAELCLQGLIATIHLADGIRNDVERIRLAGPVRGAGLLRYLAKVERSIAPLLVGWCSGCLTEHRWPICSLHV